MDKPQGFVVKPNAKQAEIFEKNREQMNVLLAERQGLQARISEIDTARTRLQGRQDGLVATLVSDKDVNFDEIFQYIWDDEAKVMTIVLKIAQEEKPKLSLVDKNGEEKVLEAVGADKETGNG